MEPLFIYASELIIYMNLLTFGFPYKIMNVKVATRMAFSYFHLIIS